MSESRPADDNVDAAPDAGSNGIPLHDLPTTRAMSDDLLRIFTLNCWYVSLDDDSGVLKTHKVA